MATNEIVEKLNKLMEDDDTFNSEANTAYFFIQLRKLMEREDILDDYKSIKFYCDWIVHPNKKYNHADVADIYEVIYQECVSHYSGSSEVTEGILALMQFDSLKRDIDPLLDRYGLNRTIIEQSWIQLTKSFLSILNDQPLIQPSDRISKIVINKRDNVYVVKVTFTSPLVDSRGYPHQDYTYGLEYSARRGVTS